MEKIKLNDYIIGKFKQQIDELLKTYVGGEAYFDKLDEFIKNDDLLSFKLFYHVCVHSKLRTFDGAIFSGEFGCVIVNNDKYFDAKTDVIVQGGLRKGKTINLEYCKEKIEGKKLIFFDDSFYSGKTIDVIKNEVERLGGELILTAVVYDGCKKKQDDVFSLFRYWDYYSERGCENDEKRSA